MTYKEAREKLFAHLQSNGWKLQTWNPSTMRPMVVPWASKGDVKVWFKPQAVLVGPVLASARSTFLDIRKLTPEQFVKAVTS